MSAAPPIIRAGPVSVPLDYPVPVSSEIVPVAISATFNDPTNVGPYVPALVVLTPDGHQLGPYPLGIAVAAGASARVSWFPGGELDEAASGVSPSGVIVETFYVSSVDSVPHTSTTVLQSGRTYIVTVQGTFSERNVALTVGSPQPDAMFPTSAAGRVSTQVGWDAECIFAEEAGGILGHDTAFRMDLGDGLGMRHVEPVGGPFGTPQSNFFYTYEVTGSGQALQAQVFDSVYIDNYGKLLVTNQTVGGASAGGSGSLLPDPTLQPAGGWLRTSGGVAVWSPTPQVTESDVTLADVTTLDVSTTKHGLAPKAPNDATKFLNGVGAYAVPAGSSPLTTKGDLYTHAAIDARLGVGSDTQVLIADSGQTTGLRWGAVPSGSGGAITLICSQVLGVSAASFDTNAILGGNIPGSYSHLRIVLYGRVDDAAANAFAQMQFNGDTAANYDWAQVLTAASAGSLSNSGANAATALVLGRMPGNTATANRFASCTVDIPMYAGTTGDKAFVAHNHEAQSTAQSGIVVEVNGGTWRSTAAITRIVISDQSGGNFVAGSAFSLYGLS